MIQYSKLLSVSPNFRRSANILFDGSNCDSYILSTSSMEALRRIFVTKASNSLALIGPFGSGKSSFLLYLEALLSADTDIEVCLAKFQEKDKEIYQAYDTTVHTASNKFLVLKIVGEHHSLKKALLSTLQEKKFLKKTNKLIKSDEKIEIRKLLTTFNQEVEELNYSGVLFMIDELGKFIEYASESYIESDIHTLQDLAEYVNSQENYRMVVALHKNIRDYVQNTTRVSYTEWDKIQGRFENIFFQDDFYELMHIFQESIKLQDAKSMKTVQNRVKDIYTNYKKLLPELNLQITSDALMKLAPLHPFASLALFHIFSKYFQNQRSIFSFLSAQEPHSFQSFINNEQETSALYGLPLLFDYIDYLTKAYSINMVDKESWQRAKEYLEYGKVNSLEEIDIVKCIGLISAFRLDHVIKLDDTTLPLVLPQYQTLDDVLTTLKNKGFILFKKENRSYALIEEATIDIEQAITDEVHKLVNLNYEDEVNRLISKETLLAKRFYIEKGTGHFFSKLYIENLPIETKDVEFKLVHISSDTPQKDLLQTSKKFKTSIFCTFKGEKLLRSYIDEMTAISNLLDQKEIKHKKSVRNILNSRLLDYRKQLIKLLSSYESLIFDGKAYQVSMYQLQQLMSKVFEDIYDEMPIINNVMINDVRKLNNVPQGVKQLFEALLNYSDKEFLGIEKNPPEKAIYLSVIQKAGLHKFTKGVGQVTKPKKLNFEPSWNALEKRLKKGNVETLDELISLMQEAPYGLNELASKFYIFLFLITHENNINFFRDNTYQFDFDIHEIMFMWKNTKKYTLQWYELTKDQEELFGEYLQLFTNYVDLGFSKQGIKAVSHSLYEKYNHLPAYCRQTLSISEGAQKLRSAISSSKEPNETFFVEFPKALGYEDVNTNNIKQYIEDYRKAFNEIVFSYKNVILDLDKYIAKSFNLLDPHYPYNNQLSELFEKFANVVDSSDSTKYYRVFTSSYGLVEFINDLAFILMEKKVSNFFDHDVDSFKRKIDKLSQEILSKVDIVDLIQNQAVEAKKLKITTLNGSIERVVSVEKSKIEKLNSLADQLLDNLDSDLDENEKAYVASLLAEKTWRGNHG